MIHFTRPQGAGFLFAKAQKCAAVKMSGCAFFLHPFAQRLRKFTPVQRREAKA